jgi:hypothetical protein
MRTAFIALLLLNAVAVPVRRSAEGTNALLTVGEER